MEVTLAMIGKGDDCNCFVRSRFSLDTARASFGSAPPTLAREVEFANGNDSVVFAFAYTLGTGVAQASVEVLEPFLQEWVRAGLRSRMRAQQIHYRRAYVLVDTAAAALIVR